MCVPPLEQGKFHAKIHIQGGLTLSSEAQKVCKYQLLVHVTVIKNHHCVCAQVNLLRAVKVNWKRGQSSEKL